VNTVGRKQEPLSNWDSDDAQTAQAQTAQGSGGGNTRHTRRLPRHQPTRHQQHPRPAHPPTPTPAHLSVLAAQEGHCGRGEHQAPHNEVGGGRVVDVHGHQAAGGAQSNCHRLLLARVQHAQHGLRAAGRGGISGAGAAWENSSGPCMCGCRRTTPSRLSTPQQPTTHQPSPAPTSSPVYFCEMR
jgi:hypothetical protein